MIRVVTRMRTGPYNDGDDDADAGYNDDDDATTS